MAKLKDDQTTAGTGKNAGASDTDTPADDKREGQQGKSAPDAADTDSDEVEGEEESSDDDVDTPDEDEDDDEAADDEVDERVLTLTQTQLNDLVKKRLNKSAKKFDARIKGLEKERDGMRAEVAAIVQAEVDALPEEVKVLVPGKLDSAAGLKRVREWLPGAKALALKLGGGTPAGKKTPTPGNPKTPAAAGVKDSTSTPEEETAKAAQHPVYRW